MDHFKDKTLLWVHNHFDAILLTSGTVAGGAGFSLITVHEWLAVILQITGLISFVMFFLMNYKKAFGNLRDILSKIKSK